MEFLAVLEGAFLVFYDASGGVGEERGELGGL